MDHDRARVFANEWVDGWNAHDLAKVLSHFADDVVFTSPIAGQLFPESGGVIRGKVALRKYWEEGLRRIPDLHFHVVDLYVGVETLVINYRNQKGTLVSEVLTFDGDVVTEGHGTYVIDATNPAGTSDPS